MMMTATTTTTMSKHLMIQILFYSCFILALPEKNNSRHVLIVIDFLFLRFYFHQSFPVIVSSFSYMYSYKYIPVKTAEPAMMMMRCAVFFSFRNFNLCLLFHYSVFFSIFIDEREIILIVMLSSLLSC